jgi:transposase
VPFRSRKPLLVLDVETQPYLQTLSVSRTAPAAQVERAGMLLAAAAGHGVSMIARRFGTNRVKVNDLINRALQVGARAALVDLPRAGRPRTIPDDARAWVTAVACQKPKDLGYADELWTTRLLAQHVRRHCEAAGHPSLRKLGRGTVSKFLAAAALKPHKITYYLERRDPDFDAKMANVLCVYKQVEVLRATPPVGVGAAEPPPHPFVAVLSYDEKPGIQVLQPTSPDRPPVPRRHGTVQRDHEYIRHGTLSLLCGIDLLTGKVLGRVERRHRSREFIAWLTTADATYPADWKIRLVLDNHSAHISKETRAYLATVPNRFEFIFTPKHGSWLNLVEIFFSKLARTVLRGIRADSPAELRARIEQHLDALNQEPVVFTWKYRLDEIALTEA